jgi:hypothetical protein
VLSLSSERYRHFDPGRTLLWLMATVQSPTALCLRTDRAFLIQNIITPAWHPREPEAHVLFLCAEPKAHWDAMRLVKESVRWAKEKGCLRWWICSETENSIEALARRMGAEPAVMRYKLDLS